MDTVTVCSGLLVTIHKKRTYMILFHSYALWSLVQSPNRMANSSLALNREVYMDALTVCSGLLVTIHKKRRTYMILFHCYALGSLVKSPNRMANSSIALNREVYMRCSNSLQWFISNNSQEKKNVHDSIPYLCLGSLVQFSNRMVNSSLALNREVYMDAVTVCSGLLVTIHKKRRTYMILFHSYALGSLVQSPNRMVNSSLALNREVYMDAVTVCSGLLVTIHKKRRTYMILFHSYALGSLVQSPNRMVNSSLALNREVYMNAATVCSGLLVTIHKKRKTYMILWHCYALGSLVQSPNRMVNSSLAINREVYMDAVTVCSGLLVIIHKKRRTYMILFHCYALGSLVQSPNRMVNSSLALNREVYMDAVTVCSGLLATIHKKRRTYMILFHTYVLGSLVQSPNRMVNSSLALNREVYMDAVTVCSGLLVMERRTYMILFHSYAFGSLVQSPNRMVNSSLALNREVYMDAVTVCSGLLVTVYRGKKNINLCFFYKNQ